MVETCSGKCWEGVELETETDVGSPRPTKPGDQMLKSLHKVVCLQDEGQGPGFEARVVVLVESMIPRSTWRGPERLAHGSPFRGMSLLHLAAAQGYARLIETLSQWRSVETGSLDLEQEVDPLNVDHFSCTPLVRMLDS